MTMHSSSAQQSADLFSGFHAVVLDHWTGSGRVRWSPSHGAWLANRRHCLHEPRDCWEDSPGETLGRPDAPSEEACSSAVELAQEFVRKQATSVCQRCWQESPGLHFIAPNVYGDSEIYCVQMPSYTVVDSNGGSGQKKHWGSPYGCRYVGCHIDSGWGESQECIGPLAAHMFGRPLPAAEVIAREWCSLCTERAHNVRNNAMARGQEQSEWTHKEVERQVKYVARQLMQYYGG